MLRIPRPRRRLALPLLLLHPCLAQPPALTPRPSPFRLLLPVVVPPGTTTPLRLADNAAPLPATPVPATTDVTLVLDALNSSHDELTRSLTALQQYLRATPSLPQPTTVLIVTDTDPHRDNTTKPHPHQLFLHRIPATTRAASLLDALDAYTPGLQQSGTDAPDRVRLSLQALSAIAQALQPSPAPTTTPTLHLVLWLSPGWPLLADAHNAAQVFNAVTYTNDLLRSALLVLSVVDPTGVVQPPPPEFIPHNPTNPANSRAATFSIPPGPAFFRNFLAPVRSPADSNPNDLALQVLALHTGGLVLESNNDLAALLRTALADAPNLRLLAATPSDAPASTPWHTLTVTTAAQPRPLRAPAGFYLR